MADGRVARLTRSQSQFGVQLDSLADQVTFGVAPAVIVYQWGLQELGLLGMFASFVLVACSAIRLARFNLLAEQSSSSMKYFIGVPTPLSAGVLVSLVMCHQHTYGIRVSHPYSVLVLVVIVSYLMVSNVRYRTFKDFKITKKSMTLVFSLLVLFALIATNLQPAFALLAYLWGYLVVGLIEEVVFFRRRRQHKPKDIAPMPLLSSDPQTKENQL